MTEEIKHEVTVATASAIIVSKNDPYMVLVAMSEKHPCPVIPGGKIEVKEIRNGVLDNEAALECCTREVMEEIGTKLINRRLIGVATDPNRDVRIVPFSKVKTALITPALPAETPNDVKVRARYGCPDYIYVGAVNEDKVKDTAELTKPFFMDIRKLKPNDLSAGHDVIVLWYREMLDRGWDALPKTAMRNFEQERQQFSSESREPGPAIGF